METRPRIKIEASTVDKFLENLGWFSLFILWVFTCIIYSNLPDIIPIHFNFNSQVDKNGSKSTIMLLPILGTIIVVGFTILCKYPHLFNYPIIITTQNVVKQYKNAINMLRYFKLSITLLLTLIVFLIEKTTIDKTHELGNWVLPLIFGMIFIPLIYFILNALKNK